MPERRRRRGHQHLLVEPASHLVAPVARRALVLNQPLAPGPGPLESQTREMAWPGPHAAGSPGGMLGEWRTCTLALFALDAVVVALGFAIAYGVRFKLGLPGLLTPAYSGAFYSSVTLWAVPAWLALFAVNCLYDRRYLFAGAGEYIRVLHASTGGLVAVVLLSFLYEGLTISRGWLLLTWGLVTGLACLGRFIARRALHTLQRRGYFLTPTLIVGGNDEGVALAEQLTARGNVGVRVLGFIDPHLPVGSPVWGELAVLGGVSDIAGLVQQVRCVDLVVATTALSRPQLLDLYRQFGQDDRVELRLSSGLFEVLTTGVRVQDVGKVTLMTPHRVRITGLDALVKGAVDYTAATLALILLSPLLLALMVLIRWDSPGGAIHRRRVLGVSGRQFDAFKFRTMVANADEVLARDAALRTEFAAGYKLRQDPRITRVGRFLRSTSFDELPQLINVLRGEMSLVGPRMIVPDEAERYGKWQINLLTVKPGLTGPWQVHGRSDLPYPERVRLSMQYIRNWTIWLDIEILLKTVVVVVRRRGAY